MAKISSIEREKKCERLVQKYRSKREKLKNQAQISYARGEIPWEIQAKLQLIPRNANPTRVRRRCETCGRARSVYREFKLCRLCLRKFVMLGYIPGLKKASW